ncbi:MAG: HXXEE domain-containing protein [Clostridium sp.]|nr:HXXEE domain-containing protein [Clostridium sp.]
MVWLCLPVYFLHQFEEYIWPGDFVDKYIQVMVGGNKDQMDFLISSSFWINVPVIWGGFSICSILAQYVDLSFGLFNIYFTLIAIFPHFFLFSKVRYNGGLVASVLLNLPISVYGLYYYIHNQLIPTHMYFVWLGITLIIWVAFPTIIKKTATKKN